MPVSYYRDAMKQAQKEFRACTAKGKYPYLPVLDDFVTSEKIGQGIDLGFAQVPMELLVGTKTGGRTQAFARNFMPLMGEDTEFAGKWRSLCQSHLEEGIRDPIKVYEYLHRYYVEEGNKRVSVLKFFGADSVYAQIIRVLPDRNGSREVEQYYEFVDFYKYSQVSFLEFSKPGSYTSLQQMLGKQPGEEWTDEDRRNLAGALYYFRQAYEAKGGKAPLATVGDAMLTYIQVYGYPKLRGATASELKKTVAGMWEEITLQKEVPPLDVKLAPEEGKEGLLSKVLPKGKPECMKVAFLYDKTPDVSGWTFGHELGRQHVQRVFGGEIETIPYFDALETDPLALIEEAIGKGCTAIFTTSPRMLPASLRAAVEHPKIAILNCSLNAPHRYVRTYYARMYEAKFIAGAVAGSLAGTNPVGYLCDYPIFGQVAGVNAFALGVQMVNPRVKVFLEWSSASGGVPTAVQRLRDRGISLISSQDRAKMADRGHSSFGLSLVNDTGQVMLAMPVWQWGVYYEALLRHIRSKAFQWEYEGSGKALNYYWGMSAGVVELRCTDKVPDSTKKLAAILRDAICTGHLEPFRGPLYAQDGRRMAEPHQALNLEQIINMDWLAENIQGAIPEYDQLDETGKATVGIVGVDPSTKEKLGKEERTGQI